MIYNFVEYDLKDFSKLDQPKINDILYHLSKTVGGLLLDAEAHLSVSQTIVNGLEDSTSQIDVSLESYMYALEFMNRFNEELVEILTKIRDSYSDLNCEIRKKE